MTSLLSVGEWFLSGDHPVLFGLGSIFSGGLLIGCEGRKGLFITCCLLFFCVVVGDCLLFVFCCLSLVDCIL